MKRFHVHLSVQDLDASIRFYSTLFATDPTVRESAYAKWMLEDPRVNFAISTCSGSPGIDHLGIQAEDADELAELGARLNRAGQAVMAEPGAECCHAKSDKVWSEDPQGTRWETFHTVGNIATYHGAKDTCEMSSARAVDLAAMAGHTPSQSASCCAPVRVAIRKAACAINGCNTANH